MAETTIEKPEATPQLTPREDVALFRWKSAGKLMPLSPSKAVEFFALFLNGTSCEQIVDLNPGYDLGLVIHTRLVDGWDRRVAEHRDMLYRDIRESTKQLQAEAVVFTADTIRAAHKLLGQKLKRFIQTGDVKALEGMHESFLIRSQKQYRDAVEMLLKLTGQDRETKVQHDHNVNVPSTPTGPMTPEQAADMLAALEKLESK